MCNLIIHFTDSSEQAKVFNYLIHNRIGFTGIDENTIKIQLTV